MMHFVNWTNQLAIHQSALMRGIVRLGWRATMVVDEEVSPDRRALGWDTPDFGGVNIVVRPQREEIERILGEDPEHTIHAFGAALEYPWGRYALRKAAQSKCKMGLMSEASDPDGWKGPLRWLKHSVRRMLFGERMQFVLAMGQMGVRWFTKCGYPMEKVFPFGYFVEQFNVPPMSYEKNEQPRLFHIVCVAALIPRKRVDLLIRALGRLPSGRAHLIIVGDGTERARLEKIAGLEGVAQAISWCGALPNQQVRQIISESDLLVLPSRYDGWGAVVNEALMAGTPVICTDHCGAKDLLGEEWRGEVVPRNNLDALVSAIARRLEQGSVSQNLRARIRDWSGCITGSSAAAYLQVVFEHVYNGKDKPIPPWQEIRGAFRQ